jgi:SAM-dependent methyltransferase
VNANEKAYFRGEKLIGDDFSSQQLDEWYADEKEGYANLGSKGGDPTDYGYHATNRLYGFRFLPDSAFRNVVGIGSAFGGEFIPYASRIQKLSIVEPSEHLRVAHIGETPVSYSEPNPDGTMPFEDNCFSLVTCFGVLHHIANVSFVLRELVRITEPGGYLLIREPTISMGYWTRPRRGLTKRERGIPRSLFESMIAAHPLKVVHRKLLFTALVSTGINRLAGKVFPSRPWNNAAVVRFDAFMASLTALNYRYHEPRKLLSMRPTNIFYVLNKQS